MNIRKNIDYSEMYEALDILMQKNLPHMELYFEIGKAVCRRTEKGAAVMASEYLNKNYPDVKGFSTRSLRRMRDFYRTYENHPTLLSRALKLGWIQNVVIMEADLTMDLRDWYMKAAEQFGWSKTELIANIAANAHENIVLTSDEKVCHIACKRNGKFMVQKKVLNLIRNHKQKLLQGRSRGQPKREVAPLHTMWFPISWYRNNVVRLLIHKKNESPYRKVTRWGFLVFPVTGTSFSNYNAMSADFPEA